MIKNKASFDAYELSVIFREENVLIDNDVICNAVSTDSRTIEEGNIFVALKGETFDGHDKIDDAAKAGASAIVVNKSWYEENKDHPASDKFIIAKDTLDALGSLARFHRDRFNIPVVAIAGSNGKTTTKEITAHILSQKFNTLKTHKNFNNRVGVPLMLLSLNDSFEAAVLELGTNEPGEIALLSNICNPTYGLITNIGKEHLEFLVNLDGVEMEETFLFGYLRGKGGVALINMDDNRLAKYEPILENKLTFGTNAKEYGLNASYTLDSELRPELELQFEEQEIKAKMQVSGIAPAFNAIAASSVAFMLELDSDMIKSGIETYQNDSDDAYGRMKVIQHNSNIILNDTYNANPSSMQMSLETLGKMSAKSEKIAILGDMGELGIETPIEHKIALQNAISKAEKVYIIGENMKMAADEINSDKVKHFSTHEDLCKFLEIKPENSAILVKGSRGMRMEKIVSELLK